MRPSNELVTQTSSGSVITGTFTTLTGFPASVSSFSSNLWTAGVIRQSFQVSIASGTMWGSFVVQVSNDQAQGTPPAQFSPTNWNSLGTNSCTAIALAGPNSMLIPYFETSYEYTRVQFVSSSLLNSGLYSIRVEQKAL